MLQKLAESFNVSLFMDLCVGQAVEFKFESKFLPLQVIWHSWPKAISEDKVLTAESMA